jgi:hypothetical protein
MTTSKPIRFRKAILGLTTCDTYAREVTVDDIINKWSFICSSGYSPANLVKISNSNDIEDYVFEKLMKCLNSYL